MRGPPHILRAYGAPPGVPSLAFFRRHAHHPILERTRTRCLAVFRARGCLAPLPSRLPGRPMQAAGVPSAWSQSLPFSTARPRRWCDAGRRRRQVAATRRPAFRDGFGSRGRYISSGRISTNNRDSTRDSGSGSDQSKPPGPRHLIPPASSRVQTPTDKRNLGDGHANSRFPSSQLSSPKLVIRSWRTIGMRRRRMLRTATATVSASVSATDTATATDTVLA